MAKKQETGCPLQLSHCFEGCCRYFIDGQCMYEEVKRWERRQREKADKEQSPARRVSDGKETVRMSGG